MRAILIVVYFLVGSSAVYASCSGPNFNPIWDGEISITKTSDNGKCTTRINRSQVPIYAAEIVSQPKNGKAFVRDRLHVSYRAAAGFKGIDTFTFQWIGKKGGVTPSAAKINLTVVVK